MATDPDGMITQVTAERDCLATAVHFAIQWSPDAPMGLREGLERILATMPNPERGFAEMNILTESATEYRVPVPEGGGTHVIIRRQQPAFGSMWAATVPGWGGGKAWTAEGWQESISALSLDRLFCWPSPGVAMARTRAALRESESL